MKYIYLLMLIMVGANCFSQSGINTTNPNTNADLELGSTDKGLLINRIALIGTASAAPLGGHVAGMVVYNTATAGNVTPGFYYNNGSSWVRSSPATEEPWFGTDDNNWATSNIENIYTFGSVGIGTTALSEKLNVAGGAIKVENSASGSGVILFDADGVSATVADLASIAGFNGGLSLSGVSTAVTNPQLFIANNGKVGIGLTTPNVSSKLHVAGAIEVTFDGSTRTGNFFQGNANKPGVLIHPSGAIQLQRNGANGSSLSIGKAIGFAGLITEWNYDAFRVGSISITETSTSYNTTSDGRLKENFTPVTEALKRLNQIEVSNYNFISAPSVSMDGFIAQQLQPIIPEAVTGDPTGDVNTTPMAVDYSKVVPLLTAAVQELSVSNQELKAENEVLKADLEEIKKTLGM